MFRLVSKRLAFGLAVVFLTSQCWAQSGAISSCDVNSDGVVNKADVDLVAAMALGKSPCTVNINGAGVCNISTVQRVVNAALGQTCALTAGSHSVTLTWGASASSNVAGYQVYRASVSGGPYTILSNAVGAATNYLDTTVAAGKTYFYVVTAVDTSNVSSTYSNEAKAVVPNP